MAKNVTLKEVLHAAANDCKAPESVKDSIWAKIQQRMSEPPVAEPQLFDGDYPAFGTDVSELI